MTTPGPEMSRAALPPSAPSREKVVVNGKWPRLATIFDEEWLDGQLVADPDAMVEALKRGRTKADIFSFAQKVTETRPRFRHYFEWDNVAAIPLTTFDIWWLSLPQVTRKNVRRSVKRGVVVHPVAFDEALLDAIVDVYNADPIRQGVPNAHYGKEDRQMKREVSTYRDTSEFIGAYHRGELIGYVKLVYVGAIASFMNIVAKNSHQDKRPMNALVAKAVEIALQRGKSFLVYGKYHYGNKGHDALAEFKRRNGFQQINVPRYFIPLNERGKWMMALGLHRGALGILPEDVIKACLQARRKLYALGFTQRLLYGRRVESQSVEAA